MKTKRHILNKLFLIATLTGVLLVFTLLTNPESIALPLLVIPFGLIGAIIYQASILLLTVVIENNHATKKIIAISVASFGVVLLLLRSLNQLTWKDSLITLAFAALFWLYVWRADFLHK